MNTNQTANIEWSKYYGIDDGVCSYLATRESVKNNPHDWEQGQTEWQKWVDSLECPFVLPNGSDPAEVQATYPIDLEWIRIGQSK